MKQEYKEFFELVGTEKFEAKEYNGRYYREFEQLHDYGDIINLFDDLMKDLGRVPSKSEYVASGLIRAEEFFNNNPLQWLYREKVNYKFKWDEKLRLACQGRLARTYNSYLIEEQVKTYVKSHYNVSTASSKYIDLNFGVDLVIKHDEKLYYIHVAKNSTASKKMLSEKKNRKSYIPWNGSKYYWTRNWGSAHHLLLFNDVDSSRMQDVNGNLLFSERYLERYFDAMFERADYDLADETSELWKFKEFLKKNGIK